MVNNSYLFGYELLAHITFGNSVILHLLNGFLHIINLFNNKNPYYEKQV